LNFAGTAGYTILKHELRTRVVATSPVKQTGKRQPSPRKAGSNEPAEQTSGRRQKTVAGKGFGKPADVEDKLAAALLGTSNNPLFFGDWR
jgi:hypothetical protein